MKWVYAGATYGHDMWSRTGSTKLGSTCQVGNIWIYNSVDEIQLGNIGKPHLNCNAKYGIDFRKYFRLENLNIYFRY